LEHAYLTAYHGAFAVAGIQEEMHDLDETELSDSRLSMAHTSQDTSSVKITSAQVVGDVIINALGRFDPKVQYCCHCALDCCYSPYYPFDKTISK
jgi:hypothetical protein